METNVIFIWHALQVNSVKWICIYISSTFPNIDHKKLVRKVMGEIWRLDRENGLIMGSKQAPEGS